MKLRNSLLMASVAAIFCAATPAVWAQDDGGGGRRGNFDPAEFQQRMMQNIRDQMSVTNDDEWKIIEQRVQKVFDTRREVGAPGFGRLFGRGRGGPDGGGGGGGGGNGGGRRGFFGGNPSPELEALQKTVDSNAPAEQVKAAMQRYRDSRKAKEAALEKAQADLRQILSVKQEAVALSLGLVN